MSALTYAQALNDARQMIVQQQLRIKADAEKLRSQQQTISDQSATISTQEKSLADLSSELQRMVEEASSMSNRCQELTTAKEQAEAIVDRQGTRLTQLQGQMADMEKRLSEQATTIESLSSDLESTRGQLPTQEDKDALFSMTELLSRRPPALVNRNGPAIRMADSGSELAEGPIAQAA